MSGYTLSEAAQRPPEMASGGYGVPSRFVNYLKVALYLSPLLTKRTS